MQTKTPINKSLLSKLQESYPEIKFVSGNDFIWSPKDNRVEYVNKSLPTDIGKWALIHEVAHADLKHISFEDDFSLLQLEIAAWRKAREIAKIYDMEIDSEHIEDCLDTYRDWLHNRSTCPKCGVVSLQGKNNTYTCFNCRTSWKVPNSQVCRVTRRIIKNS